MFSPYNSLKNFEASGPGGRELGESVTVRDKGETRGGSARVFFSKIFSGNQLTQPAANVPPKKPANQKRPMPPASATHATPGVGPPKGQSSSKTVQTEQRKVLVKPANGGTIKQAPQTSGGTSKKPPSNLPAGPSRAPPPNQPQRGVAKWSSGNETVQVSVESTDQLSLSSYTRPRQVVPAAARQPTKGGGRSGQADRRSEVLTRFEVCGCGFVCLSVYLVSELGRSKSQTNAELNSSSFPAFFSSVNSRCF